MFHMLMLAICYDSINYCFWVSDAQQHNVVYCLDSDLNELQCFYVQMNLTGDIQQIAYQEEHDTIAIVVLQMELQKSQKRRVPA